jgi:UDP-N-acetylglucosamine 2-epimerase (non-hydrolysing)
MNPLRVVTVVGCRPNFMKVAPIVAEMRRRPGFSPLVVHTGQHRGDLMSDVFFRDLDLPQPDIHLNVGPGSQAEQIARITLAFEPVLRNVRPDLVMVVGDVSSTFACALTANKLGVPVAHVEAGLRSFDLEMPEEVNRLLTDRISDYLFASEWSGVHNLEREGIDAGRVFFVGNVMIDTLLNSEEKVARSDVHRRLGTPSPRYALLTLHRPSNVDRPEAFAEVVAAIEELQRLVPVVFPIHPRTAAKLEAFGLGRRLLGLPNLRVTEPQGYVDFVRLTRDAALVLTDSGGVQEESTILGVPCLTLRENTERPATVTHGTNRLVGTDRGRLLEAAEEVLRAPRPARRRPELWDGRAASRIVDVLVRQRDEIVRLHETVREQALGPDASPQGAVLEELVGAKPRRAEEVSVA